MSYKLVWKNEDIETDIKDMDTARYLKHEYQIAFNDLNINIKEV